MLRTLYRKLFSEFHTHTPTRVGSRGAVIVSCPFPFVKFGIIRLDFRRNFHGIRDVHMHNRAR